MIGYPLFSRIKTCHILYPLSFISCLFVFAVSGYASTLILEGDIEGLIEVSQRQLFIVPVAGLKTLKFRFATPTSFISPTVNQDVKEYTVTFSPEPDSIDDERDRFGNIFKVVTWHGLKGDVSIDGSFRVGLNIILRKIKSNSPYPINKIANKQKIFLASTLLTQSDDPEIQRLSSRLTSGAGSKQEAVMRLLNWVVDNVRYKTPIPKYDALWTLRTKTGNCQNFSHLSIALLRAAGIPTRIVGGLTLGKPWKVPLHEGSLMQSIGQGGHAWIEVYYSDLGWVSYDPQQSHLFVSPRHIKQTVGLDSRDINDSWRAMPVLPRYQEQISANFIRDEISLSLIDTKKSPQNYVLTNAVVAAIESPDKATTTEVLPPIKQGLVEFGNIYFPKLTDLFKAEIKDGVGYKTLDKETSEFVTSKDTYAQAFEIDRGLRLSEVMLAMHKFGGKVGSLWLDVVKDIGGKPSMDGVRSFPLNLDIISYSHGYHWFPFRFAKTQSDEPTLSPGRYWIILRHSKDVIVNWFYMPSNPYGTPDDTRSTAKGIKWSNILNYDFNFKLRGRYK